MKICDTSFGNYQVCEVKHTKKFTSMLKSHYNKVFVFIARFT